MQLKEVTQRAEPPITPVPSVPWVDPSRAARVAGGGEEGGHVGGGSPMQGFSLGRGIPFPGTQIIVSS